MITDNSPSCPSQGKLEFDEEKRASWFSHKGEIATPSYYKVYLAEHDVVTEMTPTERAVLFRFTFPENEHSYIVVDAFDKGSYVKVIPGREQDNLATPPVTVVECREFQELLRYRVRQTFHLQRHFCRQKAGRRQLGAESRPYGSHHWFQYP